MVFVGARVVLGWANSTGEYSDHNGGPSSLPVSFYWMPAVSVFCVDDLAWPALDSVLDV